MSEQIVRVLGFDWVLALFSAGVHAGSVVIGLRILLSVLKHEHLLNKFREGSANGGWLTDADSVVRNRAAVSCFLVTQMTLLQYGFYAMPSCIYFVLLSLSTDNWTLVILFLSETVLHRTLIFPVINPRSTVFAFPKYAYTTSCITFHLFTRHGVLLSLVFVCSCLNSAVKHTWTGSKCCTKLNSLCKEHFSTMDVAQCTERSHGFVVGSH